MIKKIGLSLFFVLFILPFPLKGETAVQQWLKEAPGAMDYPDARGLLKNEWRFEFRPDGRVVEKCRKIIKILTPAGREKYSDYRIPFDRDTETLDILNAVTVKADLTEVEVEEGAMNDVTPPFLADAQIYSNLIHKVLSYPVVEPGVALYLEYEKARTFKGEAPQMGDILYFQTNDPLLEQNVTFRIPADKPFTYRFVGMEGEVHQSREGDHLIYCITGKEAPQIKEEEFMPPMKALSRRFYFSTYKDWHEATRPFADAFYQASVPDPSIREKAEALTASCATRQDKIRHIFLFVTREIRNVWMEFGIAGYKPHPAPEVLKNRYGDWRDKAVLLASLLKAAGIESHPVLASSENIEPVADVPTMKQFDILLIAIDHGQGEKRYLNPFAENSRYGYFFKGNRCRGLEILSSGAAFVDVKPFPERPSLAENICELTLDAAGSVRGSFTSSLDGYFDDRARAYLKDLQGEELLMKLERLLNAFNSSSAVEDYELSDLKDLTAPVRIAVTFKGADFGIKQGAIMSIEIPEFPFWYADMPVDPRLSERNYPFRIDTDGAWSYTLKLIIPGGYEALHLPKDLSRTTAYGVYHLSCSLDESSRTVTYTQKIEFTAGDVPPEDYEDFKKKLDALKLLKNRLLLLEKREK